MTVTVFATSIARTNILNEYLGYMDNLKTIRSDTPMPLFIGVYIPTHVCPHGLQGIMDTDQVSVIHPWIDEIFQNINDLIIKGKKTLAHQMYLDSRMTLTEITTTNAASALVILSGGHTLTL